jgi:hypothetical protein
MNEGKLEAILNRKIDGEISQEEAVVLQEYLASHPEAQSYAEDLDGLCRVLRKVKEIEPPVGFKDEILERIRGVPVHAVNEVTVDLPDESDGWLAAIANTVRGWMRPQVAYSFAGGVAVGVLLLTVFADTITTRLRLDENWDPGSMLPVEESAFERVDSAELQLDQVHAIAETSRYENLLLTQIRVESETPVEIVLEAADIAPLGFRQARESSGAIRLAAGRVTISHVGQNTYRVLLSAAGESDLRVRLQAGSDVVEKTLRGGSL